MISVVGAGDVDLAAFSPGGSKYGLSASDGLSDGELVDARPWSMANTDGRMKSVANVAAASPPTTARPSGAGCCPPSPSPRALRVMPAILARPVLRVGLRP